MVGSVPAGSTWKNIRVTSDIKGQKYVGGVTGPITSKSSHTANNIIVNTLINVPQENGFDEIGGVFAASNGMSISNIDATIEISAEKSKMVGGIVGNFSKNKLSNVIVRGKINNNTGFVSKFGVAGIASPRAESAEINKAVDFSTINDKFDGVFVNPIGTDVKNPYGNSADVYFAPSQKIVRENPEWVIALSSNDALEQKKFLIDKNFDFVNTWTVKQVDGQNSVVDVIGIKENLIPQFPQW